MILYIGSIPITSTKEDIEKGKRWWGHILFQPCGTTHSAVLCALDVFFCGRVMVSLGSTNYSLMPGLMLTVTRIKSTTAMSIVKSLFHSMVAKVSDLFTFDGGLMAPVAA